MKVALVLIAGFLLAGCTPQLKSGEVVGKYHEAERRFILITPIYTGQSCTKIGSVNSCTPRYLYLPYWHYDDEDWVLELVNGERKGVAYVGPEAYDRLQIGDYWSREQDGGGKDPHARQDAA